MKKETALIVGAGQGLSASLCRLFVKEGMQVALASRDPSKLDELADQTGAATYGCDATEREDVERLLEAVAQDIGPPNVVVYNPSYRVRGPFVDLDPEGVRKALLITSFGGFLVAQAAARQMLERGSGTMLFTGASASVKGYPQSASFAMGKFALRGMCQSLARELHPKNIHIAHFVIDGGIRPPGQASAGDDAMLSPDAIAETYLFTHRQDRSAWTWEIELRPWVEAF